MKKTDASKLFGGKQADLARALNVSRQRIHQLPETLPMYYRDRVIGACLRLGTPIPVEMLMAHKVDASTTDKEKRPRW